MLAFGRKAMTNLDNILKSRNITFLTKVCLVKAMVFPVVMFGERTRDCSPGHAGKEGPNLEMTGASRGFSRAVAPVWGFSRGTTGSSGTLGQEDPLEEEMATHSSILTWEIPLTDPNPQYP